MGIFTLIHWFSLILAAITILSMSCLIIRQAFLFRRERLDAPRATILTAAALEYLEEPALLSAFIDQLRPDDHRLLMKLFGELLPKIRGEYADRLVNLMRELGMRDRCLAQLKSPQWWQRARACSLLGHFRDTAVISGLEVALDDSQVEVRLEAARALARLRSVTSVAGLFARLTFVDATNSLALKSIFRSLGQESLPQLIAVLESDVPESAKFLAADALGHIGELQAVPALLKIVGAARTDASGGAALVEHKARRTASVLPRRVVSASPQLRIAALHALGLLGDPRAVEAVAHAMRDAAWEVRSQAAQCAGQLGAVGAIPALTRLLEDDQWWVRFHAAESLFKLGQLGREALLRAAQGSLARTADIAGGFLRERRLLA